METLNINPAILTVIENGTTFLAGENGKKLKFKTASSADAYALKINGPLFKAGKKEILGRSHCGKAPYYLVVRVEALEANNQ
jgi:hypothetical protein